MPVKQLIFYTKMLMELENEKSIQEYSVNNPLKIVNTTRFLRSNVIVIYRYS